MIKSRWIAFLTIFFIVLGMGLYFRTYDLQMYLFKTHEQIEKEVDSRVQAFIRRQLVPQIQEKWPGLSGKELKERIEKAEHDLKKRDHDQYQDRFKRTLAGMPKNEGISDVYLLGADSYHYYDLTSRIHRLGNISDQFKNGQFFHPQRHAPLGLWAPINLHPYLGFLCYKILSLFSSKVSLMVGASALPLFLFFVLLAAFVWFAWILKSRPLGAFFGGAVLAFAPLLIQRTFFGWYDTDPYAMIFPFALFALFFLGSEEKEQKAVYIKAAIAGFLTFLFSLFWVGWPLFAGIIVFSGILISLLNRFRNDIGMWHAGRFVCIYVPTILFLMACHMGIVEFFQWLFGLVKGVVSFSSRDSAGAWPDMYLIVRETQFSGFDKLIGHIGNKWTVGIAFIGFLGYAKRCFSEKYEEVWGPWIVTLPLTVATIILSLRTERFALLCTIPLAIYVMWGAQIIYEYVEQRAFKMANKISKTTISLCIGFLLVGLIIPVQFKTALARVHKTDLRFYDDAWFHVLKEIREKSPKDSVIMTWWPSGYLATAVAERAVFTDGGSQHIPEAYWVARFYFATSEREALGVFRMLNAGGNSATNFLIDLDWQLDKAIALIERVIMLPRERAYKKLPNDWDEDTKKDFLNLTHGKKPVPSYALMYQDIIRKTSSISIIARWDFEEAIRWRKENRPKDYKKFPPKDPYLVQEPLPFPSSIVRAEGESAVFSRKGDAVIFHNGLRVNLETKETFFKSRDGSEGPISSLFYVEDGKLVEHRNEQGKRLAVAALIYEDEGELKSVLAAPQLINSMLFKMYYLRGEGFKYFKNFSRARNPVTGHRVMAYEMDWKAARIE